MKLEIYSDLHLEFAPFHPIRTDADVVILAGDIHTKDRGIEWARKTFADRPVVYVLGNHEYYRGAYPKHLGTIRSAAQGSNVHVLENDSVTIDGVTFLGATLWTDFRLMGDPVLAGIAAAESMTDYRAIRMSDEGYRKLRPRDSARIHQESLEWLMGERERLRLIGEKFVVVTHHAPSHQSIPHRYLGHSLNSAYASDLDRFVAESGASAWIHGHIHDANQYSIGTTSVISNPRGYPGEGTGFVDGFTWQIPT
jgi:Icc-related predicted phosphoesterase